MIKSTSILSHQLDRIDWFLPNQFFYEDWSLMYDQLKRSRDISSIRFPLNSTLRTTQILLKINHD